VAFSQSSSFDVTVAIIEGHGQHIENDRLMTWTLYIEKCFEASNI
jgi:hypothetical protein